MTVRRSTCITAEVASNHRSISCSILPSLTHHYFCLTSPSSAIITIHPKIITHRKSLKKHLHSFTHDSHPDKHQQIPSLQPIPKTTRQTDKMAMTKMATSRLQNKSPQTNDPLNHIQSPQQSVESVSFRVWSECELTQMYKHKTPDTDKMLMLSFYCRRQTSEIISLKDPMVWAETPQH